MPVSFGIFPIILLKAKIHLSGHKLPWPGPPKFYLYRLRRSMPADHSGLSVSNRQPLEEELKYLNPFIEGTQECLATMARSSELRRWHFHRVLRILAMSFRVIGLTGEAKAPSP